MSDTITNPDQGRSPRNVSSKRGSGRITVLEIARRLDIGRLSVYAMLKRGSLPGLKVGRQWIVTRHAYEQWERTCGMRPVAVDFGTQPEVTVLN